MSIKMSDPKIDLTKGLKLKASAENFLGRGSTKLRRFTISNRIVVDDSNSDDNFDTNPIPSRQLRFRLNFDLFLIKVNLFRIVFD